MNQESEAASEDVCPPMDLHWQGRTLLHQWTTSVGPANARVQYFYSWQRCFQFQNQTPLFPVTLSLGNANRQTSRDDGPWTGLIFNLAPLATTRLTRKYHGRRRDEGAKGDARVSEQRAIDL